NGHMPEYVVSRVSEVLNRNRKAVNGSRVLVLGVAYKRDIDDVRESPALDVMKLLHEKGAEVAYSDPHVPFLAAATWHGPTALRSVAIDSRTLDRFDAVVITTDHTGVDYQLLADHGVTVVDTRNALRRAAVDTPNAIRLGAMGRQPIAAAA